MKNNQSREFWTDERRSQLRDLAATGLAASEIGAIIGATRLSVTVCCSRRGIIVRTHTDAELARVRALNAAREKRKQDRRRNAPGVKQPRDVKVKLGTSRTHPVYRNQLPRLADGTSREALRRMIAEAVKNTAEMAI